MTPTTALCPRGDSRGGTHKGTPQRTPGRCHISLSQCLPAGILGLTPTPYPWVKPPCFVHCQTETASNGERWVWGVPAPQPVGTGLWHRAGGKQGEGEEGSPPWGPLGGPFVGTACAVPYRTKSNGWGHSAGGEQGEGWGGHLPGVLWGGPFVGTACAVPSRTKGSGWGHSAGGDVGTHRDMTPPWGPLGGPFVGTTSAVPDRKSVV